MKRNPVLLTLRRWSWLILLVPAFTFGAVGLRAVLTAPQYEAKVEARLTDYSPEEIAQFRQVLEGTPAHRATVEQLGLQGDDANYRVHAEPSGVARVTASIRASTPRQAADIANVHVEQVIDQYLDLHLGRLRTERENLESDLRQAEEELGAAEEALSAYRAEQDVGDVEERVIRIEREIATLEADRDELAAKSFADPAESLARTEEQIAARRAEIERLSSLAPQYNVLIERVGIARRAYEEAGTTAAEEELRAASEALAEFQAHHGVFDPEEAVSAELRLLERLEASRDTLLVEGAAEATDRVSQVDQQLEGLYAELDKLNALVPALNMYKRRVTDAGNTVSQVRHNLVSAQMEEKSVALAHAVRIVQSAGAPSRTTSDLIRTLLMALAGGLFLGIVLAFSLQYLSSALGLAQPAAPQYGQGPAVESAGRSDQEPRRTRRRRELS